MQHSIELTKAHHLLNHGPTVLVTTAHGVKRNIMAAASNMPHASKDGGEVVDMQK